MAKTVATLAGVSSGHAMVAAVRRFEREHGRLPRALEFFRWRLEANVSAPSQGAAYGLFPGGWAEVLQVAGATV